MANGRPGDNPITDIVRYKRDIFGKGIDDLIREIYDHPEHKKYAKEISALVYENEPPCNNNPDFEGIITRLNEIKKELQ